MLHNLTSFHFGKLLQNACALPDYVYNNTHNKQLLGSAKDEGLSMTQTVPSPKMFSNSHPGPTPRKHASRYANLHSNKANHTLRQPETPAPQKITIPVNNQDEDSAKKDMQLPPENSHAQQTSHPPTELEKRTRQVWKPGRGVVEKVDKTTGEIVHLCVE